MAAIDVWRALAAELSCGRAAVLVAVVDGRGSSPGKPGDLLAMGCSGPLAGTVGGGAGEAAAIERATTLLARKENRPQLLTQTHRAIAGSPSGMVCGGEQRIAIVPLWPSSLPAIEALLRALGAGRQACWAISSRPGGGIELAADGTATGWHEDGDGWRYLARSGPDCEAWLIGGGHVSLALSLLLVRLDFRVVVCEERCGIASFEQNTHAHERLRCDYAGLGERIRAGRRSFVGIMTYDWQGDRCCLEALASKELAYLGLLGSRSKIARLTAGLRLPDCFHAPMGLPIGSHTPEEIAVSIAAEMLLVRSRLAATRAAALRES